jgi:hypothetical protein
MKAIAWQRHNMRHVVGFVPELHAGWVEHIEARGWRACGRLVRHLFIGGRFEDVLVVSSKTGP